MALVAPVLAQAPDTMGGDVVRVRLLPSVGGELEDRRRTQQLLSGETTDGFLIRSPSARLGLESGPDGWALLAPELDFIWNSAFPFSINDGALRSARGANARLMAGATLRYGRVSLVVAPELVYEQNREFDLPDFGETPRHGASPPWYTGLRSADLPLRFGETSETRLLPGQSTISARLGQVALGASAESQWWGPGIRNALVMSNHASGIPHLFLRTSAPIRSRFGVIEGKWMVGQLRPSEYFDTLGTKASALSGVVLTLRPAFEPGLTLGVARTVQSVVSGGEDVPARFADVFTRWRFTTPGDSVRAGRRANQLLALFGRWVLPENGFEVYAEAVRQDLPASFVDFLDDPARSLGYTLGVQGGRQLREGNAFRLQLEASYLEQASRGRSVTSLYTGPGVPQGYTHDGQVIGASIGPGASSQWAAADYLAKGYRLGAFGGRIRWDNDAFYTTPRATIIGWPFLAHDVTLFGGLRGGIQLRSVRLDAEWTAGTRYNYLYQNRGGSWESADDAEDVLNHTLRFVIVASDPRRARASHDFPPVPPPSPPLMEPAPTQPRP
ncbi:MAG: capsule assembly Wzi family protein [Gemmatimonadota bacterium]|nr:capsule assembly Wzi family protein [Gemmatimonadota bacterium]